jgi:hypothetical protein
MWRAVFAPVLNHTTPWILTGEWSYKYCVEMNSQLHTPSSIHQGKIPRQPLERRLGEPHSRSDRGDEKKSQPRRESNLGRSAPNWDTVTGLGNGNVKESKAKQATLALMILTSLDSVWNIGVLILWVVTSCSEAVGYMPRHNPQGQD